MAFLALALLFFPLLCNAAHHSCTPTQRDNQMTYSINQDNPPDDNLSNCSYSWSNASTVIANNMDKLPLVTRNDLYTLETSTCITNIDWEAHCTSKTTGYLTSFKANCTTSCIKDDAISGDNDSTIWLAVGITLAGLVGSAGLFAFYRCYKSKKKDHRDLTCSWTQCGGRYTNVKVPLDV